MKRPTIRRNGGKSACDCHLRNAAICPTFREDQRFLKSRTVYCVQCGHRRSCHEVAQ